MSNSIFHVRPLDSGKGWAIDEYDGHCAPLALNWTQVIEAIHELREDRSRHGSEVRHAAE